MLIGCAPSISFVVPCFNEERNVSDTVKEITGATARWTGEYEILLVNDHSSDRTGAVMDAMALQDPHLRVFHNAENLGYGGAYKRGLSEAQFEHVMLIPGDNGFPAESIAEILGHVGKADIVIPHATNAEVRSPFRGIISRTFTRCLNWLFSLNVAYYNGAVVHKVDLLRSISLTSNDFGFQAEAVVKLLARKCSYIECSINIRERIEGGSSAMRPRNLIGVLQTIAHLLWTVGLFSRFPLRKFLAPGKWC